MAIIHSRRVSSLNTTNDDDKIVVKLTISVISYDDTDQERTTVENFREIDLVTDEIDANSDNFIKFEDLTEEMVLNWASNMISFAKIEKDHRERINSVINPPPQTVIQRQVPWQNND